MAAFLWPPSGDTRRKRVDRTAAAGRISSGNGPFRSKFAKVHRPRGSAIADEALRSIAGPCALEQKAGGDP